MVNQKIRIYVEGGGDSRQQKAQIREGFSQFFYKELGKRISVIPCGSRNNTFRLFKAALQSHVDDYNILLVDAEAYVKFNSTTWEHLRQRDEWVRPVNSRDNQCHLMVQTMEAWFMADVDAVAKFYGKKFNRNPIPRRNDIEDIPKSELEPALIKATKSTQKGSYKKIAHGAKLLALISPELVKQRSKHCDKLFKTLADFS